MFHFYTPLKTSERQKFVGGWGGGGGGGEMEHWAKLGKECQWQNKKYTRNSISESQKSTIILRYTRRGEKM